MSKMEITSNANKISVLGVNQTVKEISPKQGELVLAD